MPRHHINDGARYEKRRDLARAVRSEERVVLGFNRAEAANAGAGDHAAPLPIEALKIRAGVGYGLHAGGDAVVHEFVHPPRTLRWQILADVKAAHRAAKAGRKRGHVKT